MARDGLALRFGGAEEGAALVGQRCELKPGLLGAGDGQVEPDLRGLESAADGGDAAFGVAPLADGALRLDDEKANVVPAFDELVERGGGQQHVEVAEVAALVGVDEPAAQRVRVPADGRFGGVELDAVPCEPLLALRDLRAQRVEVGADGDDAVVCLCELIGEVARAGARDREFVALAVELRLGRGDFGLLGVDAFVDRIAECAVRGEQQERRREQRGADGTGHVRR